MKRSHDRNFSRGLEAGTEADCAGMLPTALPSPDCSAFFLIWPRAAYPGNNIQWAEPIHINKMTLHGTPLVPPPFLFCPPDYLEPRLVFRHSKELMIIVTAGLSELVPRDENIVGITHH